MASTAVPQRWPWIRSCWLLPGIPPGTLVYSHSSKDMLVRLIGDSLICYKCECRFEWLYVPLY